MIILTLHAAVTTKRFRKNLPYIKLMFVKFIFT